MALTRLNNNAIGETITAAKGGTGVTSADEIGNFVKIDSQSGTDLSNISSLDIDLPDTYKSFKLNIHLKPETNTTHVHFRL